MKFYKKKKKRQQNVRKHLLENYFQIWENITLKLWSFLNLISKKFWADLGKILENTKGIFRKFQIIREH